MKNGDNLMGDLSSTNNTVIVPLPGNDSIYYLFTIGAQNQSTRGLRYSIINIRGDSGFGEVEQKYILIEAATFEKLAAVKHCNKRDVWIADRTDYLGTDTGSCAAPNLQLGVNAITGAAYSWNTGEVINSIKMSAFGTYWLKIEQQGCAITDSIDVFLKPKPVVNIGKDTNVCLYNPILLKATNASASVYLWNTGETTPFISINRAGIYSVDVTGNSCMASDTIIVSWGDCGIFFPSAFTPNNDGKNDEFGVAGGFAARSFFMEVFDRWGNTVFITSNNTKKWDGRFKGKEVPDGAYAWIINYTDPKGNKRSLRGTVLLIR